MVTLAQEPSPTYDPNRVTLPTDPPAALLGGAIYQENCAPCHGADGNGDGPVAANLPSPPTLFAQRNAIWERSPAELFHVTKFGRVEALMPPWQSRLSDEEIWQAVYYAWDLHTSEAEVAEGAAIYAEQCAACHGETGTGDGPERSEPLLSFADIERMAMLSQAALQEAWVQAHPQIGGDLSTAQQAAVLDYIRTFTYRPVWTSPLGTGPGTITGQVVQRTVDGDNFPGGTVHLEIFAHANPVDRIEAVVEANGDFAFTDLPIDAGLFYLVTTQYKGVQYTTPVLRFDEIAPSTTLTTTLPIYETTADPTGVRINRMSWIVEQEPGALLIGQVIAFGNQGNRAFTGTTVDEVDVPVTLALPLPPGAENVGLQDGMLGEIYRQAGNVVYDTRPVPPGEATRQLFIRYRLPYTETETVVAQPLLYPVDAFNLYVAELPGMEITATASEAPLVAAGTQEIQGMPYQQWDATSLSPQVLALQLTGLLPSGAQDPRMAAVPGAMQTAVTPALDPMVSVLLGGVLLVLMAGVLVWRWRSGSAGGLDEYRRAELVGQIAQLDDSLALGQIDEADWQQQRAALKRELLAITAQQPEGASRE